MLEKVFFSSLIVVSLFFIYSSLQLPKTRWTIVGPEVWPMIVLIGIMVTSFISLLELILKRKTISKSKSKLGKIYIKRMVATIIYIVSYAVTFYYTGFLFSTIITTTSYLMYVGLKPWKALITSFIYASFALITFPVLLFIPLPTGFGIFRDITSSILILLGR